MFSFKALRTKTVIKKKKIKKKKNSIISLLPYFNRLSSFSCFHFCFVVFYLFVLSFFSFFLLFVFYCLHFFLPKNTIQSTSHSIMCKEVEGDRKHANPTIIIEYKWIPEKRAAFSKTVLSGTVLASGNFNLTSKNLRSREKAPLQFCRQWSYFLV